ncbi:MAG TPA: serine/threonine-protein kinase [Polyangiaceae bacterium]
MSEAKDTAARRIGRYVLFQEIAHGGMATVHVGRLRGPAGFSRTVAIKRLHPQFARDPEFVAMFLDEARLAARVQHPNVVSVLDVVAAEGELFLVMDYVHGESFAKLHRAARESNKPPPARIVTAIASNVLDGLHAAHEARNERGDPLGIVHRDVTPQNVMVGADGVARMLDFGIAKASQHAHATTREGQVKGKVNYMAPEQVSGEHVDRRTDVYAASVWMWEALTGRRFMPIGEFIATVQLIMTRDHPKPSEVNPTVPPELDAVLLKGLARDPKDRWQTAHEMAEALEKAYPVGSTREVGEWVRSVVGEQLALRARSIAEIENIELPAGGGSDRPRAGSHSSLSHLVGQIPKAPRVPDATPNSVEAPAGVPKATARTRYAMVAGGAVLVTLLVVWGALSASRHDAAPAASATASATAPADPSALAQTAPPDSASADPSAAASAPDPFEPQPPPQPSPTAAAPPRRWSAPRRPSKSGCNPPYTIDANGVRVPKRQCF